MTIDERLEALARRHEALSESMELATHDWNSRFDACWHWSKPMQPISDRWRG